MVTAWIEETQAERQAAERELHAATPTSGLTVDEVLDMLTGLGDVARRLAHTQAKDKAALYRELGMRLTYEPGSRRVTVEIRTTPAMGKRTCRRRSVS